MKKKNRSLKKVILALCMVAVCWVPARAEVMRGDVNGDGQVNVTDALQLINAILNDSWEGINLENADVNGNGVVNISDVIALINIVLNTPPEPQHEYVDLGLPSGTLWATCNVGANTPEEYGDYFAWGETEPKEFYDWGTYMWCWDGYGTLTKYCTDSSQGHIGFVDNKTELDSEDDAAYVNWGVEWRMPTNDQMYELFDKCTCQWTMQNGVNGCLVTGRNGNTLFLPAAGYRWFDELSDAGSYGRYWSSTLIDFDPSWACSINFSSDSSYFNYRRDCGFTVRPVRAS